MIIGLLLGISIAVSLSALSLILMALSEGVTPQLVTGAVVGTEGVASYSAIVLVVALIFTCFFSLILRSNNPKRHA